MVGTPAFSRRFPVAQRKHQHTWPATGERAIFFTGALDGEKGMPRELIDTGSDKRFVRRDEKGQFKESDDVGRSLARDQKRDSKTKPKRGEGDKGDR